MLANLDEVELVLLDGRKVSAILTGGHGGLTPEWGFVYAPGAGSSLADPFGAEAARLLAAEGITTLRFQFPYSQEGRRLPDRTPVLEATWRAAIDRARPQSRRLVIGGRSMGGRIASHIAAQGVPVDALILFAYPLHPPGKPDQKRDSHLGEIRTPSLYCSGSRDAFASDEELRSLVTRLPNARLHLLDGADHGFSVPKRIGRLRSDVWVEAVSAMLDFIQSI